MADSYRTDASLIRDYNKLSQGYKEKVWKYIKNLIRLQKAEKEAAGKLYELKGSPKTQTEEYTTGEIFCDFCGKPQNEANRLIAGPDVYICDECARICGEILNEVEQEEKENSKA